MDTETPAPIPPLHGIAFDRSRNRWRIRVTIDMGKKVVGKRITVDVPGVCEAEAIGARQAILTALHSVGLKVAKPRPTGAKRKFGGILAGSKKEGSDDRFTDESREGVVLS